MGRVERETQEGWGSNDGKGGEGGQGHNCVLGRPRRTGVTMVVRVGRVVRVVTVCKGWPGWCSEGYPCSKQTCAEQIKEFLTKSHLDQDQLTWQQFEC